MCWYRFSMLDTETNAPISILTEVLRFVFPGLVQYLLQYLAEGIFAVVYQE